MGKIVFGGLALLVVAGVLIGIGVLLGGSWGAESAGRDHTALVVRCIDANGGSVTTEQLQACIAQASRGDQ